LTKEAQIVESQVEKLILEVEQELEQVENKAEDNPRHIKLNSSREISTAQLESILTMLRRGGHDKNSIRILIKKLDENGDGMISVDDIYAIAKEIEEKEGCGVVKDNVDEKVK
jgi:LETM1 and EF-hand domain-containing protein 1